MADTDIAVTGLTTSGGPGTIDAVLTYTGATSPLPYLQLDHFEWWVASSNDRSGATHYADTTDPRVTVSGFEGEETRYFWARGVDYSGNKGDYYPASSTGGVSGTSDEITATVGDGEINLAKLDEDVTAWQQRAANSIRDMRETLQRIDQLVSDGMARSHLDVRSVRQEVAEQFGSLTARVTLVDTLAALIEENADGITAMGVRVTDIETAVNDPSTGLSATVSALSSLSSTVSTQGSSITANASAVTALEGVVGYESGSATFRLDMDYSPSSGWTNGFALQSRVDSGSTWRDIGIYGEVTASQGRVVIVGDQVVIKAGSTVAALFEEGETFIDTARIHDLTVDNLKLKGGTYNGIDLDDVALDASILTALIASNNVVLSSSALTAGTVTLNSSVKSLVTTSLTPNGGTVTVMGNCEIENTSGSPKTVTLRINENGSFRASGQATIPANGLSTVGINYVDTSPSSATWELEARFGAADSTLVVAQRFIQALNFKR